MESIIRADIFFFISSISTIIITIVFLIVGFYFIKIMINFYKISKILRSTTENVESGLKEMGEHIRQSPLFTFFFGKEKKSKKKE
jgi:hypothetical protein